MERASLFIAKRAVSMARTLYQHGLKRPTEASLNKSPHPMLLL
jgi:hypothetical protein